MRALLLSLLVASCLLLGARADLTQCVIDFGLLENFTYPDSLQMVVFSGKSPFDAGDYYGCRLLGADVATYCVLDFTLVSGNDTSILPTSSLATFISACLPASCSSNDVTLLGDSVLGRLTGNFPIQLKNNSLVATCGKYDGGAPTPGAAIAITVVCFLIALVAIGTALDFFIERTGRVPFIAQRPEYKDINNDAGKVETPLNSKEGEQSPLIRPTRAQSSSRYPKQWMKKVVASFLAFSVKKNFVKIFTPSNEKTLVAFNGLRAISMAWVIFGHTGVFMIETIGLANEEWLAHIMERFSFQFMQATEFSVDSFFFMSGFLNTYLSLTYLFKRGDELEKKRNPQPTQGDGEEAVYDPRPKRKYYGTAGWWGLYYFHRFWRLTPVYAFMIMFYAAVTPYLSSGPFWYRYIADDGELALCYKYWWTNLLYINNLYPTFDSQCYDWGWYLANDMQFYVFTPIVLFAYIYHRYLGWILVWFLFAGSVLANLLVAWHYNLTLSIYGGQDVTNMYTYWYAKPWTRAAPYIIGIGMAFLVLEIRKKHGDKFQLGPLTTLVGYIISAGLLLVSVYGTYPLYHDDHGVWSAGENITYIGFSKSAFTFAVAFIIFCSIMGGPYGGDFLRAVLGNNLFTYMARLTYCAYLVHPVLIWVLYMSWDKAFYYSDLMFTQIFVANLVLSFTGGFLVSMLVEAPFINLEKILMPTRH